MNSNEDILFKTPAASQWRQIGVRPHHGICLPLPSLHSEKSCGIGEYCDLIPFIHWCKEVGMDVIQLLPLNDTGLDTSPYSAMSAFALSPLYLSLASLPNFEAVPDYQAKLAKLQSWNLTQRVKYNIVRELKLAFLREYFKIAFPEVEQTTAYLQFLEEQKHWLFPYALFKSLKEEHFWQSWEQWPVHLKSPSEHTYHSLLSERKNACDFHVFLQFLCYQQLENVKKIAFENGINLKGDIPILISRDSADVWHNRHLFLMHLSAGAPPDMYSHEGQHWGFPLYDWEELEKQNYGWWRQRLQYASHFYHLYRIDHVVGFFRIWGIPEGKSAREGSFFPPQPELWIPQGRARMQMMLETAPILPIGEDLGLVPTEVKECLYSLGICGTKMMRWERRWETDGGFIPPKEYQVMTMATVSTHDSDTLQLWWRHFPKEAKFYSEFKGWPYEPFLSLEHQEEILRDCHHAASLFHINLLQEYLALFPELVAKNPSNERINVPGTVLDTNWTYRFRPTVETIVSHIPLKQKIRDLLA